ncbi:MAG: 5-oxoprolinase subunit B/C family protein [Candidatus Dormibacteria bacterium]
MGPDGVLVRVAARPGPTATARALRLRERLLARDPELEVVPSLCTVLARRPGATRASLDRLIAEELPRALAARPGRAGRTHLVPCVYDGEDLEAVAAAAHLTPAEVVALHSGRDHPVLALGFSPGFAFLGPVAPALRLPRLATPRRSVPAGAVALAAGFTGVYPNTSPGGWHLVGRAGLRLFDPGTDPPALFSPGDRVRFVPAADCDPPPPPAAGPSVRAGGPGFRVIRPGPRTTVQDAGRRLGHLGIPEAGAADPVAPARLRAAGATGAFLEVALGGLELEVEGEPVWLLVDGPGVEAQAGNAPMPAGAWRRAVPGERIRLVATTGVHAYLGCWGGLDLPPVLGSCATDTLGGFGGLDGRALCAGDRLPVRPRAGAPADPGPGERWPSPPAGSVEIETTAGPQAAWVQGGAPALDRTEWTVSPDSDRTGVRLLPAGPGELVAVARPAPPSEPNVFGAVQLHPDGSLLVLGANRGTHGGYPKVLVATPPHSWTQLRPGRRVRLRVSV